MNANAIHILVGSTVASADNIEDYIQLVFDKGDCLTIFNSCVCTCSLEELCGSVVESVHESDELISLAFAGGRKIDISMKDESYNGPEALQLNTHSGEIVVYRSE